MPGDSAFSGRTTTREHRRERNAGRKIELLRYLQEQVGAPRLLSEFSTHAPEPGPRLPRHIWMYWHDGWDKAPEIAQLCRRSWELRNPGYRLHALDHESLKGALPDPPVHAGLSKLSGFANRVRLRLLKTHGGIWADATNFCTRPVDSWIGGKTDAARFLALTLPNADRPLATWFLAAQPDASLLRAWDLLVSAYFETLESERREVHVYFFFPYIFEFILAHSEALRAQWERMPQIPVTDSGRVAILAGLQEAGHTRRLKPKRCAAIAQVLKTVNMQKLTWKGAVKEGTPAARQVLEILEADLALER